MRFFCILICLSHLFFHQDTWANFTLIKQPALKGQLAVDQQALCQVASNTLSYLNEHADDEFAVHAGAVFSEDVTLARVKQSLTFLCQEMSSEQLNSVEFLRENFDFYRWTPDKQQAADWAKRSNNEVKTRLLNNIPEQQLLLTKYYTKLLDASNQKTEHYSQALYALPFDEQGMSLSQAEQQSDALTRYQYTRQQIIDGALLTKKLAKPLIWLSEDALHDVLLQGTGVVKVNGKIRYFNVHRNNGIAYDYTKGKTEQQRYWYFAEVPSVLGYGKTIESKIPIAPEVTFAGNVKDLGLGKLFLISVDAGKNVQMQLGVLADQGGAFDNNLFQLDWLKGSYYGWQDYYRTNKHYNDYATAWLLLKKQH